MSFLTLKVALRGDLRRTLARERALVAKAARWAIEQVGVATKHELRDDVLSSGLTRPRRVALAWRSKVFPRPGVDTLEPAALVFSKVPEIVEAFDKGAPITVRGAKYLAVPTAAAPKVRQGRDSRGRFLARGSLVEAVKRQVGPLRFVPLPGGRGGLLVAKGRTTRSGRFAAPRSERGGGDVALFVLVRQVRAPKLFRADAVARRARMLSPRRFDVAFQVALRRERAASVGPVL